MRRESFGITDRGLRRHHNEDAFLVREDLGLYVVADGMGGHAAGEVAADLAIREVERLIAESADWSEEAWPTGFDPSLTRNGNRLAHAIRSAHSVVAGAVEEDPGLRGMGATIVSALLGANGQVTLAHVGDSRAYLIRNGQPIELITSDHSWVHEQVVAGLLSADAARNHPLKNVVTRALGGSQEPTVDIRDQLLEDGDTLLLCSDGLNTMLEDDEIGQVFRRPRQLVETARDLVAEANRRGGLDNITVVLIRIRS